MNDSPKHNGLELEVADFGPIGEAKIDLRPLTVFIGPSNTGKSYLAILIYALHRYFGSSRWPAYWMFESTGPRTLKAPPQFQVRKLPEGAVAPLGDWARQILIEQDDSPNDGKIVVPPPIVDLIRCGLDMLGKYIGEEICRCFGIQAVKTLIRRNHCDFAQIILRRRHAEHTEPFQNSFVIGPQGTSFASVLPAGMSIEIDIPDAVDLTTVMSNFYDLTVETGRKSWNYSAWKEIENLTSLVSPQILGPLNLPAFYLPADRTGVMHAHRVVVSSMIGSAPMAGLRSAPAAPTLSGVLADFLQQLIEIDPSPPPWADPQIDLGIQIEQSILDGSVRVSRSPLINYPSFTYRPTGWDDDLPLMNASSMVSELAPVVLYLRYMVNEGNVLIVEEPESHLHPAMQVAFIRQLAALVRSGVRVILTTHSEWVLEELANIVQRSRLSSVARGEIDGGQFALRPDEVGAWLFQRRIPPEGSAVTEINLDESGLFPSGFEDVAAALHNNWATISSRIGDSE